MYNPSTHIAERGQTRSHYTHKYFTTRYHALEVIQQLGVSQLVVESHLPAALRDVGEVGTPFVRAGVGVGAGGRDGPLGVVPVNHVSVRILTYKPSKHRY